MQLILFHLEGGVVAKGVFILIAKEAYFVYSGRIVLSTIRPSYSSDGITWRHALQRCMLHNAASCWFSHCSEVDCR